MKKLKPHLLVTLYKDIPYVNKERTNIRIPGILFRYRSVVGDNPTRAHGCATILES